MQIDIMNGHAGDIVQVRSPSWAEPWAVYRPAWHSLRRAVRRYYCSDMPSLR